MIIVLSQNINSGHGSSIGHSNGIGSKHFHGENTSSIGTWTSIVDVWFEYLYSFEYELRVVNLVLVLLGVFLFVSISIVTVLFPTSYSIKTGISIHVAEYRFPSGPKTEGVWAIV